MFNRNTAYNDLPLLPPSNEIILSTKILLKLAEANRALGKLDGISQKLPNPLMLVNTISLQEAKSSSEIENIFTTEDDLYKALSTSELNIPLATKEVLRYRESLWKGIEDINKTKTINEDTVIDVFQKIKQTNTRIRTSQSNTRIIKGGNSINSGEVVYTPPNNEEIIKKLLDNLFEFINDDTKYPIDIILKTAIAHYQFESIHPFPDGNGRTGRILNILILINKGLLKYPILYLSKYIINNKDDYYYYLNAVTYRNNWEDWILYMLEAIKETANYTIQKIEEITNQFESTRKYVEHKLPKIDFFILEAIFTQPYIKAIHLVGDKIKSRNTARKYLDELCSINVLELKKMGSEHVYINNDLIRIIEN